MAGIVFAVLCALATGIAFLVWAWLLNAAVLLGFLAADALERDARIKRDGAANGKRDADY